MFKERLKVFRVLVVAFLLLAVVNWTISLGLVALEGRSRKQTPQVTTPRPVTDDDSVQPINLGSIGAIPGVLNFCSLLLEPYSTSSGLVLGPFLGLGRESCPRRPADD
jgi:hypothetical protein